MPTLIAYIIATICVLGIIITIFFPEWDRWFQWIPKNKTNNIPVNGYEAIQEIHQPGPSRQSPTIYKYIFASFNFVLLIYGLIGLYLIITGQITGNLVLVFIIYIVFIAFSIVNILDVYIWQRKYYGLDKSVTEKHRKIVLCGNLEDIFNKWLKVLNARVEARKDSRIFEMKRHELIKAFIGGYIIAVMTKQVEANKVEVYFQSDSQWVTARIDDGINQRNIDRLDRYFREELTHSKLGDTGNTLP